MNKYLVARHVHICRADGNTILLDLKNDRYIGLGPVESDALRDRVEGWASVTWDRVSLLLQRDNHDQVSCNDERSEAEVEKLISDLQARGVLTTNPLLGKVVTPVEIERVVRAAPFFRGRPIRPIDVARFFSACTTSWVVRRARALAYAAERVANRKACHVPSSMRTSEAAMLASTFSHLRPFLFTAKDECLYDSFALVEFLAASDIWATWVIGVQCGPFAAHSWVQYGDAVLNDTPENVLHYTPILAL